MSGRREQDRRSAAESGRQVKMAARKGIDYSIDYAIRLGGAGSLAPDARERLEKYLQEVAFWSEKIHLIGKGKIKENLSLLMLDSFLLWKAAEESAALSGTARRFRAADIGSGAGFPGLVWKIIAPSLDVTLFERRTKAYVFLGRMIALLGLEGIRVIGEDASAFKETGSFDLLVSKASGRLDAILPLAGKLLSGDGLYITIKGRAWENELREPPRGDIRLVSARELPEKRGFALVFRKG